MTELDEDLAAMAADELDRAMTLSWRELAAVAPWGDAYDGFTAAGRQVTVERSYLWAEESGGDILCEVIVYGGPSRWDDGRPRRRPDSPRRLDRPGRPPAAGGPGALKQWTRAFHRANRRDATKRAWRNW